MATRQGLDSSIVNALSESNVYPFIAVKAFFDSGNVLVWSGTDDITISSETYTGAGSLLSVSGFEESQELKTNGVTVTISGMDETVLGYALSENYQNRKLIVYLGFLDGGTNEVKGVMNAFTGRMTTMNINDDPTGSTIVVNAENRLIDLRKASMLRYNKESQKFVSRIGVSTITYSTTSLSARGPIFKTKINFPGKGYTVLPRVIGFDTLQGRDAVIKINSDKIGKIETTERIKDGFDYPTDPTLLPFLSVPTVIDVSGIARIQDVLVTDGGVNYHQPPNLKVLGNDKIDLQAVVQGGSVVGVQVLTNAFEFDAPLTIVPPTALPIEPPINSKFISPDTISLSLIFPLMSMKASSLFVFFLYSFNLSLYFFLSVNLSGSSEILSGLISV